jgi:acetyl-CoA carboxylase biotin carboxyl carrier protein
VEQGQALTHADVERIIELAEEGGFSYVRLESDGVELTLMRDGYVAPSPVPAASLPAAAPASSPPVARPPAPAPAPPAAGGPAPVAQTGPVVVSPMIGIVYLAPNPAADPYVQVGQTVEPGTVVALVEVMKMFTPVEASVGGVVSEVLVESGQHVDRGEPLFRLAG